MPKYWDYVKKGFYETPNTNTTEITDEYWLHLLEEQSTGKRIVDSGNGVPILADYVQTVEEYIEILRQRREKECFAIVNRGQLWYDALTDIQKLELKNWYDLWLNVTKTNFVPEKPYWLK